MASFQDLPNEIIWEIGLHLDVNDFLPFALVNDRFHSICVPQLSRFQALHKKWSSINLLYPFDFRLVNLLTEILEEPESVHFIRECYSHTGDWTQPDVQYDVLLAMEQERYEHLDCLRDTLSVSPLIDPESYKMWVVELDKVNATDIDRISYPPYTLIWSLLPDLHTVEIPTDSRSGIAWLHQSPQGPKLKKVVFGNSRSYAPASDDDLFEILRMPSLRELNVTTKMTVGSPIMSASPHVRDVPSALERLSIKSTALTPHRFRNIMKQTLCGSQPCNLQSFTYTHDQNHIGAYYTEFQGRAFLDVLLDFAKYTLVELDLEVADGPDTPYPSVISPNPICTKRTNINLGQGLQSFQNLQSLTVAAEMLVEGWRLRRVNVDFVDPRTTQICLGDTLPMSLRALKITSLESNLESQRVFLEKLFALLEKRYYKVPLLRVLTLGWWPDDMFRWPLLILCDKLGIQLTYDLVPN